MTLYHAKIVRDDRPNSRGEWVLYESDAPLTYNTVVREGWHVVQHLRLHEHPPLKTHDEDRSGESMYVTLQRSLYT